MYCTWMYTNFSSIVYMLISLGYDILNKNPMIDDKLEEN